MDEPMGLDELFDDSFQSGTVQEIRRSRMHKSMMQVARAAERASHLVMNIVEQNEGRMQLDEHNHLLIVGNLGIYRVDLGSFMTKFANPFDYNSFDVVEVHPKNGLVKEPKTACVQVQPQKDMPAYDLFAGYILGLLNDEVTWLQESLSPLRRTLFQIYGLARSPLTPSLGQHFADSINGSFDFKQDTFTFSGTNGWKWRLHFGQPLAKGFKIEYQKPRQTWWNLLFDDHERDSTGHYAISGFFETVEHLAKCPHLLRDVNDWSTDPILLRKVASDYPPVAKILAERLTKEDYDPSKIYTFYDELLEEEHQGVVRELDELVLQRAYA
ncbi:MAG TPA: hypothetical protein D7H91_01620 [Candidatus Poseidoniales archaeon]|nr:MAG TPA: hypothetical protein D7H91_01620 [Candidatus Poseidoniales archaeon]HII77706.1 hypothetical protein [Poseidonia sp.]